MSCLSHVTCPHQIFKGASQNVACSFWCDIVTLMGDLFVMLQGMVAAWEASCSTLDQYGMQYTRTFANLCNIGILSDQLGEVACAGKPALMLHPQLKR